MAGKFSSISKCFKPQILSPLGPSRHKTASRSYTPVSKHAGSSRTRVIPRSGLFDGFLDNVQRLTGASLSPSSSDLSRSPEDYDEDEEGTFVELDTNSTGSVDGSSETTFGPLAMLAVGFLAEEFALIREILDEMGAEEVSLVPCTSNLMNLTLGEALSMDDPPEHENPAPGVGRKVLFLSGMYASEVIEVVGALRESELPDCAFAAAVPRSWDRVLRELIEDVFADHAAMAERRAQLSDPE